MINEMNSRIKELEQQLQENDIALMGLRAKIDHITVHAVHAAKCQLINEIKSKYVPYDKLTAEQFIDLICAEKDVI
jgi:hypothetical protein